MVERMLKSKGNTLGGVINRTPISTRLWGRPGSLNRRNHPALLAFIFTPCPKVGVMPGAPSPLAQTHPALGSISCSCENGTCRTFKTYRFIRKSEEERSAGRDFPSFTLQMATMSGLGQAKTRISFWLYHMGAEVPLALWVIF